MLNLSHILARSSDDGWGGLVVAAIVIIGWIVKAISEAVKQVSKQPTAPVRPVPPPLPPSIPRVARIAQTKKAPPAWMRGKPAPPARVPAPQVPPPPPLTRPAISPAQPSPTKTRPASAKLIALRNRIAWAEVLAKPLALRDE